MTIKLNFELKMHNLRLESFQTKENIMKGRIEKQYYVL